MLRDKLTGQAIDVAPPVYGIDLRNPAHKLASGVYRLTQNCIWDGGTQLIPGSRRLTGSSLSASARIRGGHRFYYGNPSDPRKKRLVAYGTTIAEVSDAGTQTPLTTTMASDKQTYFRTWSITDEVYISNGSNTLIHFDGATFGTLTGTNIPTPIARICPVSDRLLAITNNGIERTDARSDTVWSSNSSWATFRPFFPGKFTVLHPVSLRGTDSIYTGALAFQANSYYLITGDDFGTDVTAATASTGENAAIQLIDGTVGTSSPNGVCTVPGVGTFWFTTDLNVYFIPEGSLTGTFIGDDLQSRLAIVYGLESVSKAYLDTVYLEYWDRKLILGVPINGVAYPNREFWLDLRGMTATLDKLRPAWYGPMIGPTYGVVWREDQQGELTLMAGEGNSSTGAFVYKRHQPNYVYYAQGTSDLAPNMILRTRFHGDPDPGAEKYVLDVKLDINLTVTSPDVSVEGYYQGTAIKQDTVEYAE